MTQQLAVDVGSAFTQVAVYQHPAAGSAGRLAVFQAPTTPQQLQDGLHAALDGCVADWADVALVACAATRSEDLAALRQVLRALPFQGRVYVMQPDASLSSTLPADRVSGPAAGVLAACALSRLIGETSVLAVDVGASGTRYAWIRDGRLPISPLARRVVDVVELGPPRGEVLLPDLQRHAARLGLDPREFTLVAYGGGGAAQAMVLAAGLGCARVVLPVHGAAFSAWGLLQADIRFDVEGPRGPGGHVDELIATLRKQALREVQAHGLADEDLRFEAAQTADACSLTVWASPTKPRLPIMTPADRTLAPASLSDDVINADRLAPGLSVRGPVAVRGATGLWQVPAQALLTVDSYGNLIVEFDARCP